MDSTASGGTRNIYWKATAQEPPSGFQGRSPGIADVVNEVPHKLKQFADICFHILTTEKIKIGKFRTIHLLILDRCVSRWKLSDILGS